LSKFLNPQANYNDIFAHKSLDYKNNLPFEGSILITGAQGMLGNALACAINELQSSQDCKDSKLILCSRKWDFNQIKYWQKFNNVEIVTNDNLLNLYQAVDVVIHTASPSNITKINVIDDLRIPNISLLQSIFQLKPRKISYISAGEVYGGGSTIESQCSNKFSYEKVRDWYPLVKLETERVLYNFSESEEVKIIVVRLFHTYGPGLKMNDGRSFSDILWGAVNKNQIILKSHGTQTRSFLYISDAIEGILQTLSSVQNKYVTLNLGSKIPLTIYDFAELVSAQTAAPIHIKLDDKFNHSPNEYIVPVLDTIETFDWQQSIDINTGIERSLKWMRSIKK
jgi:nucleoside-diphosphate-sugar epimerase